MATCEFCGFEEDSVGPAARYEWKKESGLEIEVRQLCGFCTSTCNYLVMYEGEEYMSGWPKGEGAILPRKPEVLGKGVEADPETRILLEDAIEMGAVVSRLPDKTGDDRGSDPDYGGCCKQCSARVTVEGLLCETTMGVTGARPEMLICRKLLNLPEVEINIEPVADDTFIDVDGAEENNGLPDNKEYEDIHQLGGTGAESYGFDEVAGALQDLGGADLTSFVNNPALFLSANKN